MLIRQDTPGSFSEIVFKEPKINVLTFHNLERTLLKLSNIGNDFINEKAD
jgi:hypothetical protein